MHAHLIFIHINTDVCTYIFAYIHTYECAFFILFFFYLQYICPFALNHSLLIFCPLSVYLCTCIHTYIHMYLTYNYLIAASTCLNSCILFLFFLHVFKWKVKWLKTMCLGLLHILHTHTLIYIHMDINNYLYIHPTHILTYVHANLHSELWITYQTYLCMFCSWN